MGHSIKIASTQQEREAIYRFRYKVYMEELKKQHIAADHRNKMLFDEADSKHKIYYISDSNNIIATVRAQSGIFGNFNTSDRDFFGINEFTRHIDYKKMAIVDRLMIDKDYRHSSIAMEMMLTTYLLGIEIGTRICFITCDEKLLSMYLKYGFRMYAEPSILKTGEKRHRLILCLCDKNYIEKLRSPLSFYLPENLDDKGKYARIIEENAGFKLTDNIQTGYSFSAKNTG